MNGATSGGIERGKQMAVDYKILLWKYLNHIGVEEGITFVYRSSADFRFTEEEFHALTEIDAMESPD
jgi:hypothetical protein